MEPDPLPYADPGHAGPAPPAPASREQGEDCGTELKGENMEDFAMLLGLLPVKGGYPQIGGKRRGEPGVFSIRDFGETGRGLNHASGVGAEGDVGAATHGNDASEPAGNPGEHGHRASHR